MRQEKLLKDMNLVQQIDPLLTERLITEDGLEIVPSPSCTVRPEPQVKLIQEDLLNDFKSRSSVTMPTKDILNNIGRKENMRTTMSVTGTTEKDK